jgi:hypothetical protein
VLSVDNLSPLFFPLLAPGIACQPLSCSRRIEGGICLVASATFLHASVACIPLPCASSSSISASTKILQNVVQGSMYVCQEIHLTSMNPSAKRRQETPSRRRFAEKEGGVQMRGCFFLSLSASMPRFVDGDCSSVLTIEVGQPASPS